MIEIIIPTFGRADRLAAVAANVAAGTVLEHQLTFVVEADDADSIAATYATGANVVVNERERNYAGAVNTAYELGSAPHLFAGADDLNFHTGWDVAAMAVLDRDDWVDVAGTNDLLNLYVGQGFHATHYLVRRRYLDEIGGVVDQGPGSFLCELYSHQYTDTEFIGTAKWRAKFRPCLESVVEHMHFAVGKAVRDATYDLGYRHIDDDSALYDERRELWFSLSR